ncbi:hypothetical protein Hypma_012299 [Hypsizygus marmoreus]|uniref:Uncharacterized protein n=1 Tax=Hypsizygus marmoreus TaxID=39966 RepID=A0A369JF55_HYPMA|nr:hypothetical protein Hypma_012299 [Hypsizygus marmoreus]
MDPQDASCSAEFIDIFCLATYVTQWLYHHLREWLLLFIRNSSHRLSSMTLSEIIYQIFERPSEWPVNAYFAAQTLLTTHPHIIHLVAFSIFFGPIAALLPFLLLHELVISVVFHLSFMMHGFLPGTTDSRYRLIRATLQDIRESLFHSVDAAGATYNTLTTKYWPLVAMRLCAFAVGGLALYRIWSEKNGGLS